MARVKTDRVGLATDAWRAIFDFVVWTAPHRNLVLGHLGLTPNDARALSSLGPTVGRTMRSLANEWGIDASTATWIVDRLEAKSLAERHAHPTDRRVKLVRLTPDGVRARRDLFAANYAPPSELLEMNAQDLTALRDAAVKLPRPTPATTRPSR